MQVSGVAASMGVGAGVLTFGAVVTQLGTQFVDPCVDLSARVIGFRPVDDQPG